MRKGLLLAVACLTLSAAPAQAAPDQAAPATQPEVAFDARYEPTSTRLFKPRVDNIRAGSRVVVRCSGQRCPLKSYTWKSASGSVSLYRFAYRRLKAGVRLRIEVTEPGGNKRQATIKINAARAPTVTGTLAH
ncbi:MAG TPA: hypothetical protein VNS09_23440 [Solirubrobacter sp.]|nr:hypothetical protein [Solirubrobacter sp.]